MINERSSGVRRRLWQSTWEPLQGESHPIQSCVMDLNGWDAPQAQSSRESLRLAVLGVLSAGHNFCSNSKEQYLKGVNDDREGTGGDVSGMVGRGIHQLIYPNTIIHMHIYFRAKKKISYNREFHKECKGHCHVKSTKYTGVLQQKRYVIEHLSCIRSIYPVTLVSPIVGRDIGNHWLSIVTLFLNTSSSRWRWFFTPNKNLLDSRLIAT